MDDDLSSSPVKTVTENSAIGQGNAVEQIVPETSSPTSSSDSPDKVSAAGDAEELMDANHGSLSTLALEAEGTEAQDASEDDDQEQSTVSEMVQSYILISCALFNCLYICVLHRFLAHLFDKEGVLSDKVDHLTAATASIDLVHRWENR